jgi:hypothetical protein
MLLFWVGASCIARANRLSFINCTYGTCWYRKTGKTRKEGALEEKYYMHWTNKRRHSLRIFCVYYPNQDVTISLRRSENWARFFQQCKITQMSSILFSFSWSVSRIASRELLVVRGCFAKSLSLHQSHWLVKRKGESVSNNESELFWLHLI